MATSDHGVLDFIEDTTFYLNDTSLDNLDVFSEIKNNYESIFTWEVYKTAGKCRTNGTNFLRRIQQKEELASIESPLFNFDWFYLSLISCFEVFMSSDHIQALSKIQNVISILRRTQLDTFFNQISDACFHISYITQAHIMFHLGNDIRNIVKNIKHKSNFNKAEHAMIYAIKSMVFLEYSPEGNSIALQFAESARNFNDNELIWVNVWLKAKRRNRRFDRQFALPSREEFEAANRLNSCNDNLELLLSAASVYAEAGHALNIKRNFINARESKKFYKLSSDLIQKVFDLSKNNHKLLYYCLSSANNLSATLIPKQILDSIVLTLENIDNFKIYKVLGKYFLKIKEYSTARKYFKKSSLSGSFSSSLLLLKVECLLSSVDDFPVIQYLKLLYNSYTSPKHRRYVSGQILLYYMYNENDKKELLYSIDTYLNEHIDYKQKKNFINGIDPVYSLKKKYDHSSFINDLNANIEQLKMNLNWNSIEKSTLDKIVLNYCYINNSRDGIFLNSEMVCVVCQVNIVCCALQPCGHQCVCKNCWDLIKNADSLCPVCRSKVNHYLYIVNII